MMLPVLSGALTVARAIRGLTIEEVAEMTFLSPQDVFNVENNLEDAEFLHVCVISAALDVDLGPLSDKVQ